MLTKNGLIETLHGSLVVYKTTEKGTKMLKDFKSIYSELPELYSVI
jgi:predicted transcriptional regulator